MTCFVAVDVETADNRHEHVCSIGVVRVVDGVVVAAEGRLVRPPCPIAWWNSRVHGLTDRDVRHARPFGAVWSELLPLLRGASFLVAHNAPFDRAALAKSCAASGIPAPGLQFRDTLDIARRQWRFAPADLPTVCAGLGIPFGGHHDALNDARAAASIYLAYERGVPGLWPTELA